MIKKNAAILLLLAVHLAFLPPLFSGDRNQETITLKQAVDYALSHNQDLAVIREKVNEIHGMRKEAIADAFPQVSTTFDTFRYRDPGILNSPNFQNLINDPESPIPREFIMPIPVTYYNYNINIEQPIYKWGKYGKTKDAARIEYETADLNIRAKEQEISFSIATAYYDLLLSYERLNVLEKAQETQEKNLRIVSDKYDIDMATRLDLLNAKTALSNLIPQKLAAENQIRIATAQLNYLMGRKIDGPLSPADPLEFSREPSSFEFGTLSAIAFKNRPDLAAIENNNRFLEKRIELEKTELRPSFKFFGDFGWSTIDTDNLGKKDYQAWRVGIGFSMTVFDGMRTSGKVMQIRSRITQNSLMKKYLENGIALNIERSLKELGRAYESLKAAITAQEAANEALKVAQDNFDLNMATQLDVLFAESQVREAELSLAQAKRDCLTSEASLKYLIGVNITEDLSIE